MGQAADILADRLERILAGAGTGAGAKAFDAAAEARALLTALAEGGYDVRPRVVAARGHHLGVPWEIRVEGDTRPRAGPVRPLRTYIDGSPDHRCLTADQGETMLRDRILGIVEGRAVSACQDLIRTLGWRRGWGRVDHVLDAAGAVIRVQLEETAPLAASAVPREHRGIRVRAARLAEDRFRPDVIRAADLRTATISTPGTRALGSALRWFDRTMAPEGWTLDQEATRLPHGEGTGVLVARRADQEVSLVLATPPGPSLKEQWAERSRRPTRPDDSDGEAPGPR